MTTFVTAANNTAVDLFSTVSTVARGATKTVNALVTTIDMLDGFVTKELTKQALDAKLELSVYQDTAIKKAATTAALFDAEIKEKLNTPALQASFTKYELQFSTLLNPPVTP